MSKETKKRTMIYSNVKENKRKKAEEITKIKDEQINFNDEQINLNDEFIIGLSNESKDNKNSSGQKSKASKGKKEKQKKKKATKKTVKNKKATNKKAPKKKITKKQLQARLIAFLVIILTVIIGGIVVALTNIPAFNISTINVEIINKNILTEEEIKEKSIIAEGDNIFSFSKRDIIESIKLNPYVEKVKIKRSLPNTINIQVEERSIRFQLEYNGKYINVDNQGYILEECEERKDVMLISGYSTTDMINGNRLDERDLEKLSDVIQILQEAKKQELDKEITKVDIKSGNNYILYMDNCGKIVHFGNANLINDKFSYVKKIMEIENDYEGEIIVNVDYNNGEYPYFREKV